MLQGSARLLHTNCNYLPAVTKLGQFVTCTSYTTHSTIEARQQSFKFRHLFIRNRRHK